MNPVNEVAKGKDPEEQAAGIPSPPVGPSGERPRGVGQGAAHPVGAGQSPRAAEVPPAVAAAEASRPSAKPGKLLRLLYVTLPGCWGALLIGSLSFTPSLLPRSGITQGLIWGITAAIGYGLGVLAAWIWRAFADRDARHPRRWSWTAFFIGAAVLLLVSFGLGQYWQYEIRKLMGVTDYNVAFVVVSPLIAALVFCLILLTGRGLRGLYRWVAQLLHRWIGPRAVRAVAWIVVVGLVYLVNRRPAVPRFRQRGERGILGAQHDDPGGGAPARDQLAFGRAGLVHFVGHAGPARPQLHRYGPVGG